MDTINAEHYLNIPHRPEDDTRRKSETIRIITPNTNRVSEPDDELLEKLDKYDSFYDTTKSLLVLFQIMGVMPIERKKGRTIFRWFSPASCWAYFIYAVETVFVSIIFKERVKLILQPGKRFDEYIYGVIFLSILIPHFLLPVGAWTNGSEVAKFKNMWTKFQLKYFKKTGTPIVFKNLTLITYSLCIFSWLVGILIMLAQYYLQPDMLLWHTFGYYHILAMLNCLCSLWYINCTAKGRVAGWLAENLHLALQTKDSAEKLASYREMWVDLSHMMQQLGKAYSGMYALYCLLVLLTTIVATYGCLTEILDHGLSFKEAGLFLISFYCGSLLFIICNEAHAASRKMGPEFRERLLNVNLHAVDQRTVDEVNMFLTAIEKNPPIMNLNGYANINRKLISSEIRDDIDESRHSETPDSIQSPPTSRPCSSHEVNKNSVSSSAETQRSFSSRPSTSEEIKTPRSSVENRKKKKRNAKLDSQQTDDVLALVEERLRANNNDQCAIFGKNVAAKLKELSRETRLYTEKLINDLLFEAEMGNVTKNTRIVSSGDDSTNPNTFQRDGPVLAYYPNQHNYDWARQTSYQHQEQNSSFNRNITSINQLQTYDPHTYSRQNQSIEIHSPHINLRDNPPQTIIQSNRQPSNSCTAIQNSHTDEPIQTQNRDKTILPPKSSYTTTENCSSNKDLLSDYFEQYNPVSSDNI